MERLQCRSSDESVHLLMWVAFARYLVCQYSVKLPGIMLDTSYEISLQGSKAHKWWYPR
jgi:hypothetical protein